MRNLVEYFIRNRAVTYFLCLLMVIGGTVSFFSLGQLEDPAFSIKSAVVITEYPGASPEQVEQEVTDRLEQAIQEMTQIDKIYSTSKAGKSVIKVDIQASYWSDKLPQIWDELRKKVNDTTKDLPPGAKTPIVNDDFGFVYGFVLALTGEGFSPRDLRRFADDVKRELSLVKDVTRVDLWGVQPEVVYITVSEKQLSQVGITGETFVNTVRNQNMVVNAGNVDIGNERLRIAPTGEFKSPEDIGKLAVRPQPIDMLDVLFSKNDGRSLEEKISILISEAYGDKLLRVNDLATVERGYYDPPPTIMHYNGKPAIGIQIAGSEKANIVTVGENLYKRLSEVLPMLPVGVEIHKVAWQSDLVSAAVNGFIVNLLEAIAIVLVVLIIPSGWRMGMLISSDLIMTILGTFIFMAVMKIPLERMSLGALVIALGMMVDNAIVISDKAGVLIRQGVDRTKAAVDAAVSNAYPLFAATIVAVLSFYPIYASPESTGEYCRTLFLVVSSSLIISWLIGMFVTPLQCILIIPEPNKDKEKGGEFDTPFYSRFRRILKRLVGMRIITMGALIGLFALSIWGFGFTKSLFFPDSTRPQLMVDYWAPEGTRIADVAAAVSELEKQFIKDPAVSEVTTFIGAGPPRFYLPVDSEGQTSNYAQMIIGFNNYEEVNPFIAKYEEWAAENYSTAMLRFRKYGVGPSDTWPFYLWITGSGTADLTTLRVLGNEALAITEASPHGKDWRLNMMNQTLKVVPEYNERRGLWSSVSRDDIAGATRRAYDGVDVGLYREQDRLLPIIVRQPENERESFAERMANLQVKPEGSTNTIPLSQVTDGINAKWENPIITRLNRRRGVAIQGAAATGDTFANLRKSVLENLNNMELPQGYHFFWDGEYDSTQTSQAALIPGIVPALILILLLTVTVFNAFRPMLIILITIPFVMIGITPALLLFDSSFTFMALLGTMSLAGMMNKNIVVLLDSANENIAGGMDRYTAIIEASVTRVRPVILAAGTTVLGVIPLLTDVFWQSMAIAIMAGLSIGSLLTLVLVPILYSFLYGLKAGGSDE
ncbi:MAG: efflux RND transporter permease subunit [Chlamydiales bacterium]|nr:efflux RND transporter permease subunit [Chlamydiia bacterium]MCP5507547.1 efflux RND transporter permease subunit [Chlamydiales bacterium]